MKNLTAIALFIAASFIVAGPAPAQDRMVKANVPFNFTVGDHTLPSGTYTIKSDSTAPAILEIRNYDKKVGVLSLGSPNQEKSGSDNTLVFQKYGNQYFLTDIRSDSVSMRIHIPSTKAEKRAKAQVEDAKLSVNDPVLVALR